MRRFLFVTLAAIIAVPLFATEPNPSVRQRQLIEKLLDASGTDSATRSTIDAMYAQIEKQFVESATAKGNDPDDIAEAKALFAGFRERAAKIDFSGELHEAYVRIYAKYFNEQEIVAITAFYASPAGKKTIEVMPHLMEEGMQAGMQHIGPKMEQAMNEALEEQEKRRPWRRTMSDIRGVATALEAYSIDHDEKYPAGEYSSLQDLLVPAYMKKFPEKDMWNHSYAYVVSGDRAHYRLVSAGADSNFEWDSRRIVPAKEGEEPPISYRERLEDDLIYADGMFVQLPLQTKPKQK